MRGSKKAELPKNREIRRNLLRFSLDIYRIGTLLLDIQTDMSKLISNMYIHFFYFAHASIVY